MATYTITGLAAADGYVYKSDSNWVTARDASTGGSSNSNLTRASIGIRGDAASTRGGGTLYHVTRSFFLFDTADFAESIKGAGFGPTSIHSLKLGIYGYANNSGDIIAVKSTHGLSITTADFNAITGWDNTSADGSGAGDNITNVTAYTGQISTWAHLGNLNEIPLNSVAISDLLGGTSMSIALINYDHDLLDIAPTSSNQNGMYYSDHSTLKPYLEIKTNSPASFGANF